MRILGTVLLAAVGLSALRASPLSAQADPEDVGWGHFRIGIGPGWSALRTPAQQDPVTGPINSTAEESRLLGLGAFLGFVSDVNDHLAIGVEVSGWTGIEDGPVGKDTRRTQLGLHGIAYLHPHPNGRLFLKGGLGVGVVVIDSLNGRREGRGAGLGYLIGTGYDIPVWGKRVMTPYLEIPFVRRFRGGVPNVIQVGLALGW